jgi:hypothetical protein
MTYAPYVTVPATGLSILRGAILPIGVTHHSLTLPVIPMSSLRTCQGQRAILRRMLGDIIQFALWTVAYYGNCVMLQCELAGNTTHIYYIEGRGTIRHRGERYSIV